MESQDGATVQFQLRIRSHLNLSTAFGPMPVTYRIDTSLRLVEAQYTGDIKIDDVRDFTSQVLNEPEYGPDFQLLSVFSGLKTTPSAQEFTQYKEWRKSLPRLRRIAVVATTNFEYGIARMFALATDSAGSKNMQIFRSLEDARQWLGLPDS